MLFKTPEQKDGNNLAVSFNPNYFGLTFTIYYDYAIL